MDKWLEQGVKDATYDTMERSPLNRDLLKHNRQITVQFFHNYWRGSHLVSGRPNTHERQVEQQPTGDQ